jgi:hypothetical protein
MQISYRKGDFPIKPWLDRILKLGQVTRREYLQMTSLLLSAHYLKPEERVQINRILDNLRVGKLKITD